MNNNALSSLQQYKNKTRIQNRICPNNTNIFPTSEFRNKGLIP